MRKIVFIFIAAAALILSLAGCGPRFETVPGDALGTKIYTLDNGLKVYMSVNKETPRIQTYVAVRVGSKYDPSETTGLAHYFEHLMFKGSESFGTSDYAAEKPMLDEIKALFEVYRQTTDENERKAIYHKIDSVSYEASKLAIPNEYDKLMAVIGASGTNAWTSTDETVYTEDIPSNQIDAWAKIQADRFRHNVIRGFHTELETVYEEKNMSLTQDSRKLYEALDAAMFPNHPYGQQTTLGTQEHLKNPSIINIENYRETYYVPNNIAICVSGDFDPKEMVAAIEKYFGDWEPNTNIPEFSYEPEKPITEPIVKEVYGLESEMMAMAWRLPSVRDLKTTAVAEIAGSVLYNGMAGIIDINVIQAQKALTLYAGLSSQPDYCQFLVMGYPKQGQSLEELKALSLDQVEFLRKGEFDEGLIEATINNIKLSKMTALERNSSRAQQYVGAFIAGIPWEDASRQLDYYSAVTKQDVIDFANEYLADNSYVVVYKRRGEDKNIQKISAPAITPILSNRDKQSDFLKEIAAIEPKPIEPVFVDYNKDMSQFKLSDAVNVLYKKNELNDKFVLNITINLPELRPELSVAADYLTYLGTPTNTITEIQSKMYSLACDFTVRARSGELTLGLSGLSENMIQALEIIEDLIYNAIPNEDILEGVKADWISSYDRNILNQSSCFSALNNYGTYGADFVQANVLSKDEILQLKSEDLLSSVREAFSLGHEIIYYGSMSEKEFKTAITACHKINENAVAYPIFVTPEKQTPKPTVYLAQYDAKQLYYRQYSNRGDKFDIANQAVSAIYDEYFGGGMNGVVFQEMREARGLAYSAYAYVQAPSTIKNTEYFIANIATQNDKMQQAIEAFDEIINNMPQSQAAFDIAKNAVIARLRTQRTTGSSVFTSYRNMRKLGLDKSIAEYIFDEVQNIELEDVVKYQQDNIKDRTYNYFILGDIKDLDTKYLATLGEVKVLSLEEIFGY